MTLSAIKVKRWGVRGGEDRGLVRRGAGVSSGVIAFVALRCNVFRLTI